MIVNIAKTRATGPFVKIAKPRKIQAEIHFSFLSLAILLQNKRRLIPKFPHKSASLTAVLLQIITSGDKANAKAPTSDKINFLSSFCDPKNIVSPIIIIKNNDANAEGSLAERVPKLSHISFFGRE